MENKKHGFLQDDNGNNSSMRLMSIISLLAAILFGYLTLKISLNITSNSDIGLYLTFGFLLAAFAPKAAQKLIENKFSK